MAHKNLTGQGRHGFFEFLSSVKSNNTKLWIRHVVVPGVTDTNEHIKKPAEYINTIPNIRKIELLPYHTYGVDKYNSINMIYRLAGTPSMSSGRMKELYEILHSNLKMRGKPINILSTNANFNNING